MILSWEWYLVGFIIRIQMRERERERESLQKIKRGKQGGWWSALTNWIALSMSCGGESEK